MDTLDKMEKLEVDNNDQPIEATRNERIYIDEKKPQHSGYSLGVFREVCKIQQNEWLIVRLLK